ncbi:MAG: hypothetical protein GY716_03530 [bacterium]|nr:hypothetical protein [bacterium]
MGGHLGVRFLAALAVLGSLCLCAPGSDAALLKKDGLELFADFRLRAEADWDSQSAAGVERDDRTRIRIRARVGLNYEAGDHVSFGVRLRTGSDLSQQSPHITILDLDDNDTGDAQINFDKWFVKARRHSLWGSVGRDGLPFWRQNELLWDDDVTPAGIAGGLDTRFAEESCLAVNLGYFSLPVGMQQFSGNLAAAQVVYSFEPTRGGATVAVGHLAFDSDPADADAATLLNGNGLRDYAVWVASVRGRVKIGSRPLKLGVDLFHNAEDYASVDPGLPPDDAEQITFDNRDETDGFVASLTYGDAKEKGRWLAAYYYARVETLAVNASYAQDDWVRWGSAVETRGSDMRGHELRFVYALGAKSNVVARLYLVEAITTAEDGNRFRVDYNRRF